ncbi:MAG: hypothetical protein ACYTAF_17415 [Planctomycetota bacterium]|jgi:WD40 repeat protein
MVATAAEGGSVFVWDVAFGRSILHLRWPSDQPTFLVFSPDGDWLVIGGFEGNVGLLGMHGLSGGEEAGALARRAMLQTGLRVDADGEVVAVLAAEWKRLRRE